MNIRPLILWLLTITPISAIAEPNQEALSVLKTMIEGEFRVLIETSGDLNSDGLEDWVGIIVKGDIAEATQRLYVLTRHEHGLEFAEASPEVSFTDCNGSCLPDLWIKKNSFFVVQSSRGGWGASGMTTQFKLYKDQWRAIGRRRISLDAENNSEESSDENLLTGVYESNGKKGIGKPSIELLKNFDLSEY